MMEEQVSLDTPPNFRASYERAVGLGFDYAALTKRIAVASQPTKAWWITDNKLQQPDSGGKSRGAPRESGRLRRRKTVNNLASPREPITFTSTRIEAGSSGNKRPSSPPGETPNTPPLPLAPKTLIMKAFITSPETSPMASPVLDYHEFLGNPFSEDTTTAHDKDECCGKPFQNAAPCIDPIRTKRTFLPVKQARRLPRIRSCESGFGNTLGHAMWHIHAEIFEIGLGHERADSDDSRSYQDEILAGYDHTAAAQDEQLEVLRPDSANHGRITASPAFGRDQALALSSAFHSLQRPTMRDSPGQSSQPYPAHSLDHSLAPPLATMHIRGASFDLVNPHASLLLHAHDCERPADAGDCADDDFATRRSTSMESISTLQTQSSRTSLRSHADSPRRVLYRDADAARRNILGAHHDGSPSTASVVRERQLSSDCDKEKVSPTSPDVSVSPELGTAVAVDLVHAKHLRRVAPLRLSRVSPYIMREELSPPGPVSPIGTDEQIETGSYVVSPHLEEPPSPVVDDDDSPSDVGRIDHIATARGSGFGLGLGESAAQAVQSSAAHEQDSWVGSTSRDSFQTPKRAGTEHDRSSTVASTPALTLDWPFSAESCSPRTTLASADGTAPPLHVVSEYDDAIGYPLYASISRSSADIPKMWTQAELQTDPAGPADEDDSHVQVDYRARSSSVYVADNESAWETQASCSELDLSGFSRTSLDSYANTSAYGSQAELAPSVPALPALQWNQGGPLQTYKPTGMPREKLKTSRPSGDLDRAIKYIHGQMFARMAASPAEKEKRQVEARELEVLRRRDPLTVRHATEHVVKQCSMASLVSLPDSAADVPMEWPSPAFPPPPHRLEQSDAVPVGGLRFSESANTFTTVRRGRQIFKDVPPVPPLPVGGLHFSASANTFVTDRRDARSASTLPPHALENWPLSTPAPSYHSSARPAVNSHTRLRPLHLLDATPRPGRPLSSAELLERQSAWSHAPRHRTSSPSLLDPVTHCRPRIGHRVSDAERALHLTTSYDDPGMREAVVLSQRYLSWTALCPVTALAFGLGGFDRIMLRKTGGRVAEMLVEHKRKALSKYFPLGGLAYGMTLLVAGIVVWACLQ